MSENRDEILQNFQSITAIDDVAEAFMHLEESNWDLLTAICRVLPQDEAGGHHQPHVPLPTANTPSPFSISSSDDNFNNLDLASNNNNNNNVEESMTAPSSPVRMNYNIPASRPAFAFSSQPSTSAPAVHNSSNNNNNNGDSMMVSFPEPTRSSSSRDQLVFNVSFNGRRCRIVTPESGTVGDLKAKIAETCGVAICRQALRGWPQNSRQKDAHNNMTALRHLNLARENELDLTDLSEDGFMADEPQDLVNRLNETFQLHIDYESNGSSKPLTPEYPGYKTVQDVKTGVYTVTNIAVRHQVWTGWPENVSNSTTLAESGIGLKHNFTLKTSFLQSSPGTSSTPLEPSTTSTSNYRRMTRNASRNHNSHPFGASAGSSSSNNNNNVIEIDSESSVEEFEDASEDFNADDDLFTEISNLHKTSSLRHLMPDEVSDEVIGSIQFVQNYIQRYGEPHPEFYQGSLSDALAEACHKPAKDRKLLAIYLHHDGSVLTNVFCGQLLSCESIIQSLSENFVLYGWDLTYETNKHMLLSSITSSIGTPASITVRNIPTDRLPALLIISKSRSNCEVLSVIYGNVGVDDLLSQMMEAIDMYSEQQKIEIREESERADREQVLMEQDIAYKESLELDRAKEEAKQRKAQILATERQRLESEKAEAEAKREAIRMTAEMTLPNEPDEQYTGAISKIRVRKPNGAFSERKFTADTKLKILLNYVTSIGFPVEEYKMFSGWPRKDLTTMGLEENLQTLKLCPQETIILEER